MAAKIESHVEIVEILLQCQCTQLYPSVHEKYTGVHHMYMIVHSMYIIVY